MSRRIAVFCLMIPLVGCARSGAWLNRADLRGNSGEVEFYGNDGWEKAEGEMRAFCQGGYEVLSAESKSTYTGTTFNRFGNTVLASPQSSNTAVVTFRCEKK